MRFLMQNLHHTKPELTDYVGGTTQLTNGGYPMSKGAVSFEKDNEYYTPKGIVKYFGKFDYDPATTIEKAKEFGVENYDTIETNGLNTDWTKYNRIWINPPFSDKHLFVEKAYETYKKNPKLDIYILFPIEFLTTGRFHKITSGRGGKLFIPNGRIKFESGLGKKSTSCAFGSIILKVQDKWEVEMVDMSNFDEDKQISIFDIKEEIK